LNNNNKLKKKKKRKTCYAHLIQWQLIRVTQLSGRADWIRVDVVEPNPFRSFIQSNLIDFDADKSFAAGQSK